MTNEIWKDIVGSNFYQVSSLGRVRSNNYLGHGETHILALCADSKGYLRVRLYFGTYRKTCKVHRLVAEAFLENPFELPEVNHKDGNKANNAVFNLEWTSSSDNVKHAYRAGLKQRNLDFAQRLGKEKGSKALKKYRDEHQVPVVATRLSDGIEIKFINQTVAAKELGLFQANVNKVLCGKRKSTGGYTFRKLG